ncbi:hypothetical protein ACEQ8H_003155 [Pleosporales sp. CAS-2024a]
MYQVFRHKWITPPKPVDENYAGRNVIITGSTSGIGEEAAYKFAALGAKVIITARDAKKGETSKSRLEARLPGTAELDVWELDMMSYDSVVAFAQRAQKLDHVDMVVLNAGVYRTKFHKSQYGWEEDLQVNTLSTALLALLLLPKLRASKRITGRIPILEFVNSGLHQSAVVPSEIRRESNVLVRYNQQHQFAEGHQYKFSKVFLMYAATFLSDNISSEDVIITSICPGWVNTNLGRDHFFPGVFILVFLFMFLFVKTPSQGANMILSGTTQGEMVHGRFWQHDRIQPIPPSLRGDEMKDLGRRVFEEIVMALSGSGLDMQRVLTDALSSK